MDDKYGRLFTREDVLAIVMQWSSPHERSQMQEGQSLEDTARAAIDNFEGKFPEDEPLFLLRGKDELAEDTIVHYESDAHASGCDENFLASVNAAREQFESFRRANPDRMKLPD